MRWMSRGLLACGLVSMLLHGRGLGEPIRSWGELRAREKRRAGIFGQWSPDPAKVERALRLLERRRQGKLSEGIEGQLAGTTRDVSDMELLARSYLREGRVALARTQLGKIIEKDPASRGGRLLLAEIYERCGRDGLAAAELEALARLRREELGARRRLAALYTRTRRMADAVRVLKDLVRMQPDDLGVQRQLVRALAHAGDYPVAKAAADALLRADPEGIETRLILAECYRVFRQPDEARKVLETLDKEHARADVAEALARVLLGLQDAKAADRVLAPWLDKADVKPLLLAATAVAAQGSGNVEKASSLCYRLRAGGLASLATDILANVWVGRRDAAAVRAVADAVPGPQRARMEAYTALLQAVSRAPADAQRAALLLNVATVLRLAGWSEESTDLLSIAGRIAPDTALIGSRLARARAAAGWQEGAVALWEKLVGDFPDSKPLAVDYAQALRRGRELEKAASICREAMKKPGDNTELRLLLSDIAAQQGRYEAAISAVAPMLGKDAAHADAYARTVTARLVLGELAAIDRAFTERRIVEPGYLPGALERIVRLAQREKQASAIAQAEHTLAQAPFEWRWQFLAGLLYERAGRWAEAAEAFDAVRMIRPAL
ncbi:tetratricopeptide repeat protein, partial [bacterium]|nr:tetratricopeptide repeat protein [bacterium]